MFDILVYLFENYLPDACPEPSALAKKLLAAGFEDDDITQALDWLAGFDASRDAGLGAGLAGRRAVRIFDDEEATRLPSECRGFLTFLEHAEAIDGAARELIIERALALPDAVVALGKLKVIVLMVVWRQQLQLDSLILEELLSEDGDEPILH